MGKSYGISKEESKEIWDKHTKEMIERSLPIWNIYDFLDYWRNYKKIGSKYNEIIIVTARDWGYESETKTWLKQNRIDYDEIYLGFTRKVDAVRQHCLDVMVDDKASHIKEIDKYTDCEGFLVDRPYNRWYGTQNRVYVEDIPISNTV